MPISGGVAVAVTQPLGSAETLIAPAPLGTGSDDRQQLIDFLATTAANSTILFRHSYLVSMPGAAGLPLPSGRKYVGVGVAEGDPAHIKLLNGSNPAAATAGVVVAKEWDDNTNAGGAPTIYEGLFIDGNAANNTGTYSCLIPFGFWTRVVGCKMDSPRLHHVLLTKLMKNGTEATGQDFADNRIIGNRFRNGLAGTDGAGIRHLQAGGVGNHNADLRAYDNHFESCQHGIWADSPAGWSIFENHIWARRNGINIDNGWFGLSCDRNYIDSFGEADEAGPYYGIRVKGFGVSRIPTINGNRISGPDPLPASATGRYWIRIEGGNDNASAEVLGNTAKGPFNTPSANAFGFSFVSAAGTLYLTDLANHGQAFNAGKDKEYSGTIAYKTPRWMTGTGNLPATSVSAGATATVTITVTGAAVGDTVAVGWSPALATFASWRVRWAVTATNTVTVLFENITGSPITPASTTVRATVTKFDG